MIDVDDVLDLDDGEMNHSIVYPPSSTFTNMQDTTVSTSVTKATKGSTRKRKDLVANSSAPTSEETTSIPPTTKKARTTSTAIKKATAVSSSINNSSAALNEARLPKHFYRLLMFFDLCDKIYCFLSKMNMKCSMENLTSMYSNLITYSVLLDDGPEWQQFQPLHLVQVCSFCPTEFLLNDYQVNSTNNNNNYNNSSSNNDAYFNPSSITATESKTMVELTFKQFLGIGKGNINSRRKLLLQAMTQSLYHHIISTPLPSISSQEDSSKPREHEISSYSSFIQKVNTGAWPDYCLDLIETCPIPSDSVNVATTSTSHHIFLLEETSNSHEVALLSLVRKATKLLGIKGKTAEHSAENTHLDGTNGENTSDDGDTNDDKSKKIIEDGFTEACAGLLTPALAALRSQVFYRGQMRHIQYYPAKSAVLASISYPFPPLLQARIEVMYPNIHPIHGYYRHQAMAMNAIRQGKHVMMSTSTASGKSLAFNLPIIEQMLHDYGGVSMENTPTTANDTSYDSNKTNRITKSTALYLFPTKALAQDQLRSLHALLGPVLSSQYVIPVICDGDTSFAERQEIMKGLGNVILTNPDMLHHTLLPEHVAWARIFQHLKYVVLDEAHMYSGAFGTHVACILRRLLRVCLAYNTNTSDAGSNKWTVPQFICCSATISNPREHMCKLIPLAALAGMMFHAQKPIIQHNVAADNAATNAEINDTSMQESDENERDGSAGSKSQVFYDEYNLAIVAHDWDGAPHGERSIVVWNPYYTDTNDHENKNGGSHSSMMNSEKETEELLLASEEVVPCMPPVLLDPSLISMDTDTSNNTSETTSSNIAYKKKSRDNSYNTSDNTRSNANNNNSNNSNNDSNSGYNPVSIIFETALLFSAIIRLRLRTLAFCRTRKLVELVYKYSVRLLQQQPNFIDMCGDATNTNTNTNSSTTSTKADNTYTNNEYTNMPPLHTQIASYRGGYTQEERRQIETQFFQHLLLGIVSTNALEVGIDVGSLDVTMHMGFPGSFASLWQQIGRAGRANRASLAFVLCFECPIDQYFATHPHLLLNQASIEPAVLDCENVLILKAHIACAAKEIPLNYAFSSVLYDHTANKNNTTKSSVSVQLRDEDLWGRAPYLSAVEILLEHYQIRPVHSAASGSRKSSTTTTATTTTAVPIANNTNHNNTSNSNIVISSAAENANSITKNTTNLANNMDIANVSTTKTAAAADNNNNNATGRMCSFTQTLFMFWSNGSYTKNEAAKLVNIRMIDPVTIQIMDDSTQKIIDALEYSRAFFELFENAIFLHRGQQFLVVHLSLSEKVAHTIPVQVKYMTSARNATVITVIKIVESTFVHDDASGGDQLCIQNKDETTNNITTSSVKLDNNDYIATNTNGNITQKSDSIPPTIQNSGSSTNKNKLSVHYGIVQVVHKVYGYVKKWLKSGEIFETGECSLPPLEYETAAVWIDLPVNYLKQTYALFGAKHTKSNIPNSTNSNIEDISSNHGNKSNYNGSQNSSSNSNSNYYGWKPSGEEILLGSIHALNHLLLTCIACVGSSHGCDVQDLGTEHDATLAAFTQENVHHPWRLLVYDKRPGGLGMSANAFVNISKIVQVAREIVHSCKCGGKTNNNNNTDNNNNNRNSHNYKNSTDGMTSGCPACVLDCRCTSYNRNVHKKGAMLLLDYLAAALPYVSSQQPQQHFHNADISTTVVSSSSDHGRVCSPCSSSNHRSSRIMKMSEEDILDFSSDDDDDEDFTTQNMNNHDNSDVHVENNDNTSSTNDADKNNHDHSKRLLIDVSPTKQTRQLALKRVSIRDSARSRGMTIQHKWSDMAPDFITDSHRDNNVPLQQSYTNNNNNNNNN